MKETPDELEALQQLLDDSFAQSSEHLLSIMEPHRRLTAQRLVDEIPSPAVLNIATVTAKGEPRVSGVDGHFLHARWHFSTLADSPKAHHLAARPAISAAYTPKDGYGVFCHGKAVLLGGAALEALLEHLISVYGAAFEELGEVTAYRIEPHWMTAFAMTDEEMAEFKAD
jgi:hypothetical protein